MFINKVVLTYDIVYYININICIIIMYILFAFMLFNIVQ